MKENLLLLKDSLEPWKLKFISIQLQFQKMSDNLDDDIVNNCNNTYHNTIKMKPVDVKSITYIDSSKEIYSKDPKFKIGDTVRISKYENIFQEATFQIGLKRFLWLKKLKTLFLGHTLLVALKEKKLLEHFTKTNCKSSLELRV